MKGLMERYIAIDDVCAWPNLTPMPDGFIAAVIFNQPTHGGWQGMWNAGAARTKGGPGTEKGGFGRARAQTPSPCL